MAAMFRRVQKRYDLFNHLFSFGRDLRWRSASVNILQFSHGDKILDFGAGTGDFSLALRKRQNVNVVAVDLARDMLRRFKTKLSSDDSPNLTMVLGDGERLPFADGMFEGAVAGFVGRNLFDLTKGLEEIRRVLKSGGKLGFLEFAPPEKPVIKAASRLYLDLIIAPLGNLFLPKDVPAYSYLIHSVRGFYTALELCQIFKEIGFKNVRSYPFNLGTVVLTTGEK